MMVVFCCRSGLLLPSTAVIFYSSAAQTFKGEEHPAFLYVGPLKSCSQATAQMCNGASRFVVCDTDFSPSLSDLEMTEKGIKCGKAYQQSEEEVADCIIPVNANHFFSKKD